MAIEVLGIVWYNELDYDRCRALFIDGHTLPESWKVWREQAESVRKNLVQDGVVVIPTYIDPNTFPNWCASHGLLPDHQGRSSFASAEACRAINDLCSKSSD